MHASTINNRENCIEKLSWLSNHGLAITTTIAVTIYFSEDEDMQMSVLDDDCV